MAAEPPTVSVLICTKNRSDDLAQCLRSLARAGESVEEAWELLVVDNGSTDETRAMVHERAESFPVPLRYEFEPVPGLSRARNRAVSAASGRILYFVDDDCIVADDWLEQIVRSFRAVSVSLVGGRVELFDEDDASVGVREATDPVELTDPHQYMSLIGCNFGFRRELVERIGDFDEDFGAGGPLKSFEDVEFVFRALQRSETARYCPSILVYHNHGRRDREDVSKLEGAYSYGRGGFLGKCLLDGNLEGIKTCGWWVENRLREVGDALTAAEFPKRELMTVWWFGCGLLHYCVRRSTPG